MTQNTRLGKNPYNINTTLHILTYYIIDLQQFTPPNAKIMIFFFGIFTEIYKLCILVIVFAISLMQRFIDT